jgi:hypothetical protein
MHIRRRSSDAAANTCIASAELHLCNRYCYCYRYCYWYCHYCCCHCATPARQMLLGSVCAEQSTTQRRAGTAWKSALRCAFGGDKQQCAGASCLVSFFVRLLTRPYAHPPICSLARFARPLVYSSATAPRHRKAYRESNRPPARPLQPPASISRRASTASTTPFAPMPRSTWPRLCSSASSSTAPS